MQQSLSLMPCDYLRLLYFISHLDQTYHVHLLSSRHRARCREQKDKQHAVLTREESVTHTGHRHDGEKQYCYDTLCTGSCCGDWGRPPHTCVCQPSQSAPVRLTSDTASSELSSSPVSSWNELLFSPSPHACMLSCFNHVRLLRPYGLWSLRLPRPWVSPGENTEPPRHPSCTSFLIFTHK